MIQTIEAIINPDGTIHTVESVKITAPRRALVTILDEDPTVSVSDVALLSEPALAKEWLLPEEDAAWSHLQ